MQCKKALKKSVKISFLKNQNSIILLLTIPKINRNTPDVFINKSHETIIRCLKMVKLNQIS